MSNEKKHHHRKYHYPLWWKESLGFWSRREKYEPWYGDDADYQTNAKSYYDYLARFNKLIRLLTEYVNRALDRDLMVEDTNSIILTKQGDWQGTDECNQQDYDDIITLLANVRISTSTETRTVSNITGSPFTINNGSSVKTNGVWSPDYIPILNAINSDLGTIKNDISSIKNDISSIKNDITNIKAEQVTLRRGLQQIVDNLFNSGAITNNNINTFTFKTDRNIATGNINLFGGTPDGNSFIRTNSNSTNNDITAGY